MKTLKLSILAALLFCTVSAFAINKPEKNTDMDSVSKKELIQSLKENLNDQYPFHKMNTEFTEDLLVYCSVKDVNKVKVLSIEGQNEAVKQQITDILENYPVNAPVGIHGHIVSFKVHLEVR